MRQERDSLGDVQIPGEAYYGIGTARLLETLSLLDREFPSEIARALVCVRQAQATAYQITGQWPKPFCEAVKEAANMLVFDESFMESELRFNTLFGGGVRGIYDNINEVLANLTLEKMGASKGEYHLVAPLFQDVLEHELLAIYMTAVHVSLLNETKKLSEGLRKTINSLQKKAESWREIRYLRNENHRDVAIASLGDLFAQYSESLQEYCRHFDWSKARLLPCWRGTPDVLLHLREITGIELAMCQSAHEFPTSIDRYLTLSSELKSLGLTLVQFCSAVAELVGKQNLLNTSRIRAGQAFNPTEQDLVVAETVNQAMFLVIGGDAVLSAIVCAGGNGVSTYAPFFTSQLLYCVQWVSDALNLLADFFVDPLSCNAEVGEKHVELTPLQAERLVPILGYDRSVQVARIAALTEKPVQVVVAKMKLMTEEMAKTVFGRPDTPVEINDIEESNSRQV